MSCIDASGRECPAPQGSECHCGQCHQTFSGMGLFDSHQSTNYADEQNPVLCASGATLGLVQDARGTWCTPQGLKARQRSATQLARARQRGRQ